MEGFLPFRFPTPEERTKPLHKAEEHALFKVGDVNKVYITHAVDPNDFYVILDSDRAKLEKMNDDIGIEASFTLTAFHPIRDQTTVVVLQTGPKSWARGKVLSIEDDKKCLIHLIDLGETMEMDCKRLKTPPEWVLKCPPLAYHCSLGIVPAKYSHNEKVQQEGEGFPWADSVCLSLQQLGKYGTVEERNNFNGLDAHCLLSDEEEGMNYIDLVIMPRNQSWPKMLVSGKVAAWAYPEYERASEEIKSAGKKKTKDA